MSVLEFGSGVVFGVPVAGNLPVNPSPFKMGVLQECTVDFKGELKKLFGQLQFPVATARGKVDVSIKGKLAVFDALFLNQMFFAQVQSSGYNLIVDSELHTVSAAATTASNVPIVTDYGVQYAATGQQFQKVNTSPGSAGLYQVTNLTTGSLAFNAADNGTQVKISYTYAVNVGATVALAGQLMGYAPELKFLFYNKFRNKYVAVELNDVTVGSVSLPSKLDDFWISDFEGSANLDASSNLGNLYTDLS